jgi:DNA-binding MarR family transcriptional regulator
MNNNKNNLFLLQLALLFILIEVFDSYLDYILGITLFHTLIQIVLYLVLFVLSFYLFNVYYKKKIKVLLPQELVNILIVIDNSTNKNILPNNKYLLSTLNITKPTLKKRLESLENLEYILYEKKGNNKYLKLTDKGKAFIK